MFDSMRIRTKLAVALVVPLVALAVLSLTAISASSTKADDASARAQITRQQVELATSSIGPGGVITALQAERNVTALEILGLRATLGELPVPQVRATTDKSVVAFRATIADSSAAVQTAYQPALDALASLEKKRAAADDLGANPTTASNGKLAAATYDELSKVVNTVFDINTTVALGLDDADLRSGARFIDQMTRLGDNQTLLLRTIALTLVDPTSPGFVKDPVAFGTAQGTAAQVTAIQHDLETSGTPFYRKLAKKTFASPVLDPFNKATGAALAGKDIQVTDLISDEATQNIDFYNDASNIAAKQVMADAARLIDAAEAESTDASNQADLVRNGTILVMILALGVALIAARSIARPLRRLADDAEDMATTRLPGAVQAILDAPLGEDVETPQLARVSAAGGAEIGELATALNTVQDRAAELAIEQAILLRNISDSFVNLGRRNQNLLSRQLDSITEMEREETDPDELEKLFTLDHLATRMRRNAESLLLLAGLEPHRQWSAPVALIDVIRGALGEVEDYARVEISRFDDAMVNGSAAADLTHLVAELLENALNFSPPGRNVMLAGARRDHGYMLAIVDNGIGMDPEDLEQANIRLAGKESFSIAPSRYLGHYVVGIQAQRLGTPVSLQDTPVGGVTVLINISSVIADGTPTVDESSDQPAVHTGASDAAPAPQEGQNAAADRREPEPAVRSAPSSDATSQPMTVPIATVDRPADADRPRSAEPALTQVVAPAPTATPTMVPVGSAGPDDTTVTPEPAIQSTASGYKQRVRGTHTPRTEVVSARAEPVVPSTPADEPSSSAEDMRSMLSGLQAGAKRAQAEVEGANDEQAEDRQ
ncbi:MAG: ATP-binding protein [Aquihabitans sp.]